MSCSDATAPIDISKGNVVGKCDLKCEFGFRYNDSACIATNRGDYISLSYETSSSRIRPDIALILLWSIYRAVNMRPYR
jgi:hypothetical protein